MIRVRVKNGIGFKYCRLVNPYTCRLKFLLGDNFFEVGGWHPGTEPHWNVTGTLIAQNFTEQPLIIQIVADNELLAQKSVNLAPVCHLGSKSMGVLFVVSKTNDFCGADAIFIVYLDVMFGASYQRQYNTSEMRSEYILRLEEIWNRGVQEGDHMRGLIPLDSNEKTSTNLIFESETADQIRTRTERPSRANSSSIDVQFSCTGKIWNANESFGKKNATVLVTKDRLLIGVEKSRFSQKTTFCVNSVLYNIQNHLGVRTIVIGGEKEGKTQCRITLPCGEQWIFESKENNICQNLSLAISNVLGNLSTTKHV